jgi:hypothetical protein
MIVLSALEFTPELRLSTLHWTSARLDTFNCKFALMVGVGGSQFSLLIQFQVTDNLVRMFAPVFLLRSEFSNFKSDQNVFT